MNERLRSLAAKEVDTFRPRAEHVINGILHWLIERKVQTLPLGEVRIGDDNWVRCSADANGQRTLAIWDSPPFFDVSRKTTINVMWDENYGSSMPATISAEQERYDDSTPRPFEQKHFSSLPGSSNSLSAMQVYSQVRSAGHALRHQN